MEFEKLTIEERKIIVGIDFGTTYSGIAWAETQRPDRRLTNTSWPISKTNHEGESSDKVPTKLRYTKDGTQWGFTIPVTAPEDEIIEWFKLDLDPSVSIRNQDVTQTFAPPARAKKVNQLVTDYLSALINHLLYILREKLGETIVKSTPLEFVVTVPAIWTELAKERTRKACQRATERANIASPIHLISEPEAAAIFALHGLDPHGLKVGDTIVVVDAGGGTVDLISYTVTGLKPILEVKEAAPGSGALCGSTFLNKRFATFLKSILGKEDGFDDEVMGEAMEVFEKKVKRQFTLSSIPDETYSIPVGGLANNKSLGISRGRYSLKASDVVSIFEPVVIDVIKLVRDQIDQSAVPVKAVLLVGGFGASNYLKERIRDAVDPSIQIMQPPQAWQAVVQGAVMKGLANSAPDRLTMVGVRGRKARKHYGTDISTRYNADLHSQRAHEIYWCGFSGHFAINTMSWFIERGDEVFENEPFTRCFCHRQAVARGRPNEVSVSILMDAASTKAPIFREKTVKCLAKLKADVSSIPEDHFARREGHDGQPYYYMDFSIELVYLSASTQYTLIHDGTRYNTVTCEYV